MPSIPEPRYRLSLTAKDIATIMSLIVTGDNITNPDVQIVLAKFAPLNKQIAEGTANPTYTTTAKESLEEKLGMTPKPVMSFGTDRNFESKEEYWNWAYEQVCDNKEANQHLLEPAREHMYLHSLMTPEEEADFEEDI